MSPTMPWTSAPAAVSSCTHASSVSLLRSTMATLAPCFTSSRSVAKPRPLAPPVMTIPLSLTVILFPVSSEIRHLHARIGEQFATGPFEHDLASLDDIAVIGNLQGKKCVLLDEQHCDTQLADFYDRIEDLLHQDRR